MPSQLENKLVHRGIKPTAMRLLVIEALSQQSAALSLAELEKNFTKADRITLYRTLKTFEEHKLIHSINDGTGSVKYALCIDGCMCNKDDLHLHFHCVKCRQTTCLVDNPVPPVKLPDSFLLYEMNLIIKGVCSNCTI